MSEQQLHPFSELTPEAILTVIDQQVASIDQWTDGRIYPLNSYENRVYHVGLEDREPVIAKFYRPERWSKAQIAEEHGFIFDLVADEQCAVAPIQIAGESVFEAQIGEQTFYWCLFPRRGGRAPELTDPDCAFRLGMALGRLHNIGASKPFSARENFDPLQRVLDAKAKVLAIAPEYIQHNYQTAVDEIVRLLERQQAAWQQAEKLRCHCDCHVGNILWRDDTAHFVDFDDSATAIAMQDIWMLLTGEREEQRATLAEVVAGYEEFRPFDSSQLQFIESLRAVRIVHHAGWLASRWQDPAFPMHFPWFNTERYWAEHLQALREQQHALQQPALTLY